MPDIYLVGGAVRDKLLGLTPKENDWVVIGASVDYLKKQGYLCVGKDFPVFLHPETKEEYALARLERKVAPGYGGFEFDASEHVTLEQDLSRRDLTINAIAEDQNGKLIDPFHGVDDLQQKKLRHVSNAFVEDPVRILRVARFAARYAYLGFTIADETLQLMRNMVMNGEVNALVKERVWRETEKALTEKNPEQYFAVLNSCGALNILFPVIADNFSTTQQQLSIAVQHTAKPAIRVAAVCSVLSSDAVKLLAKQMVLPSEFKQLALISAAHLTDMQQLDDAEKILNLLNAVDAFRREARFLQLIEVMQATEKKTSQIKHLKRAHIAAKQVSAKPLLAQGFQGKRLGEELAKARLRAIEENVPLN